MPNTKNMKAYRCEWRSMTDSIQRIVFARTAGSARYRFAQDYDLDFLEVRVTRAPGYDERLVFGEYPPKPEHSYLPGQIWPAGA